jgi:hypothetical protein
MLSGAGISAASRRIVPGVVDAGHEDAVRAGLDVSGSPLDGLGESVFGSCPEVGIGSGVDDEPACRRRGTRRRDPGGGFVDPEQLAVHLVLEVGPDHAELRRQRDGPGHGSTLGRAVPIGLRQSRHRPH